MKFKIHGFPPEYHSNNMYAGPGADSLDAAAEKWQEMRWEMHNLAAWFRNELEKLKERSSGPSAIRMTEAAALFGEWLGTIGQQLAETGDQVSRFVALYHEAHRGIVSPQLLDDLRAEKSRLEAGNALGLNAGDLGRLQTVYHGWWEKNQQVMENYEDKVIEAFSALPSWEPPPPITNEAGRQLL